MSADARARWIEFHDHVERQCGTDLAGIKDFAAKAAEHAVRVAAVITIIEDIGAKEIDAEATSNGVAIVVGTLTKPPGWSKRE